MFRFRIVPDESTVPPYTVEAGTRDISTWERLTKGGASMAHLHPTRMRATDLYAVAYYASRRQGLWTGTYREFLNGVELEILRDTPAAAGDDEDQDDELALDEDDLDDDGDLDDEDQDDEDAEPDPTRPAP